MSHSGECGWVKIAVQQVIHGAPGICLGEPSSSPLLHPFSSLCRLRRQPIVVTRAIMTGVIRTLIKVWMFVHPVLSPQQPRPCPSAVAVGCVSNGWVHPSCTSCFWEGSEGKLPSFSLSLCLLFVPFISAIFTLSPTLFVFELLPPCTPILQHSCLRVPSFPHTP